MKLNLRKASAIQLAINEQINATEMPLSVTVTRYDAPVELTLKTSTKFVDGMQKKLDLLGVLYSIRQKTATVSEKAGVSGFLAESALIDKIVALLSPLSTIRDFAKTNVQLNAALDDLKKETTQEARYGYNRRDTFEASVITEEMTTGFKKRIAELKRKKQGLSDALLEANVKHEIEISEQEEAILRKYGLVG